MKGHVYQQSKGSFGIKVPVGKYDNGRTRYHYETYHGTKRGADARCAEIVLEITRGRFADKSDLTVGVFLERWLRFIDNTDLSEATKAPYHMHVEKHFKNAVVRVNRYGAVKIWDMRLADLGPETLQAYFKQTLENGRRDDQKVKKANRGQPRDRSLSPTTVHAHYRTWHVALEWAKGQDWIQQNPTELTKPPQPEKKKFRRLKAAEAKALLAATEAEWIHPLLMCALYTGLRQGEMLALRWEDIDWEEKTLIPKRTLKRAGPNPIFKNKPKNDSSMAPVSMVGVLVAELKEHKKRQIEQRLLAGEAWGAYDKTGKRTDLGLVFTTPLGTPIQGTDLTRDHLKAALEKAGLPRVRWHDLRHSTAGLLLALGVDIKIISRILRHTNIQITANTYTDPEIEVMAAALEKLEQAMK